MPLTENGKGYLVEVLFGNSPQPTASRATLSLLRQDGSEISTSLVSRTAGNPYVAVYRYTNNTQQDIQVVGYHVKIGDIIVFEGQLNVVVPPAETLTIRFEVETQITANTQSAIPITTKQYNPTLINQILMNDIGYSTDRLIVLSLLGTNNQYVAGTTLNRNKEQRKATGSILFNNNTNISTIDVEFIFDPRTGNRTILARYSTNAQFQANDTFAYVFQLNFQGETQQPPNPPPNPPT